MERDPNRIPIILEKFRKLWEANPDIRLAQMLFALTPAGTSDPYYVEDDVILKNLDHYLKLEGLS